MADPSGGGALKQAEEVTSAGQQDRATVFSRIVHDEKALLRHINIYAEMTLDPQLDQGMRDDNMRKIMEKSRALARLLSVTRMLSTIDTQSIDNQQPVRLQRFIRDILRKYSEGDDGIALVVTGDARIQCNKNLLAYALAEIGENSQRIAPPETGLKVAIASTPVPTITFQTPGTGQTEDRFFDAFEKGGQEKARKAASGLGLYVVARVMRWHGGKVLTHGRGDSFALSLAFPATAILGAEDI